ncbi:tyrosine-type recombinase/integrase [Microbaculum marinisediminis]|uniref:Site-specific integrase n=1 Tax=Microbaculum marinisediminis TaxID=2931392 RepID=A0AAW5R5N8_9HYPH|nr:site-specific integrase [Microbaculum sp. A6E488]MCT8974680.1 site-specific integrase [Microbaculum sp. A6E488]
MKQRLVDKARKGDTNAVTPIDLPVPITGNKVYYDVDLKGFGCRVTAKGARAFILNYRNRSGRERRLTIGSWPDWSVSAARTEASELKKRIDVGEDPMAELEADRTAPTVADLCERFEEEHLPKIRKSTAKDYRAMIAKEIKPALKHLKVAEVSFSDVEALHRKVTKRGAPGRANRIVSLVSKMFALAIRWKWAADNPAKGIERNPEQPRHRYLSGQELGALTAALAEHKDQQAANIIRMLLLTGARRGEVQAMRWADIDLANGIWTKPGSTTKQKTLHRVPLSAPARQLLADIRTQAEVKARSRREPAEVSEYVFPGRTGAGHRVEIKGDWASLCRAAEIKDARIHDLRHTYASILASAGLSLPVIGALLGHSQPATTARYAHLFDDPLRAATERVGALVMPHMSEGEVVEMKGRG